MLENIINLADRPADYRIVCHVLSEGVGDGGQWDMFVNLVEKYGVVPKSAMEETYQSSNTRDMNGLLIQAPSMCGRTSPDYQRGKATHRRRKKK